MIGIVGQTDRARKLSEALDSAGLEAELDAAAELDQSALELIVAVGEAGLIDVVSTGTSLPVIPTELEVGFGSVPPTAVTDAIERFRQGAVKLRSDPVLTVSTNGDRIGRSYFDVMLVRSEPGRISEYSLSGGAARSRFRADGVVVATPAGSQGYALAAGGPRIESDAAAVAIVPVAAFGFGTSPWVLDPTDGINAGVERDEGDVSLLIDGRERQRIAPRATVTIQCEHSLDIIPPPA